MEQNIDSSQQQEAENRKILINDPFPLTYLHEHYRQNITQHAKQKITYILDLLSKPVINIKMLKKACFQGIPDECKGLRSICWKILIGYLPPDKSQWQQVIKNNNETYLYLCEEFFNKGIFRPPTEDEDRLKKQYDYEQIKFKKVRRNNKNEENSSQTEDFNQECLKYKQFFDDSLLYEEVEKDTTRTRSEMHFFVTDTSEEFAILNQQKYINEEELKRKKQEQEEQKKESQKTEDFLGLESSQGKEKEDSQQSKQQECDLLDMGSDKTQEENQQQNGKENCEQQEENKTVSQKQEDPKKINNDEPKDMNNQRYKIQFRTYIQDERKMRNDMSEKHFDVLSRILYVYAKTNPGIRYVQGMNEVLAPIYYIFRNDHTSELFQETVESDAFFCFTKIMGDGIKDSFIKNLDDSDTGIKTKVTQLDSLLKQYDYTLWCHLTEKDINPHFYALRWIMLVFTQEFELFDVLRLWDSFLSSNDKMNFIFYLCLAVLQLMKSELLSDDFAHIMETLQNVSFFDVLEIIGVAQKLYSEKVKQQKDQKEKYEKLPVKKEKSIGSFLNNIVSKVNKTAEKIINKK